MADGGRTGPPATNWCQPRQARKGAAVAADSGAGVWLVGPPPSTHRRGVRAAEGARLESVYGFIAHRGFESLPLRQKLALMEATLRSPISNPARLRLLRTRCVSTLDRAHRAASRPSPRSGCAQGGTAWDGSARTATDHVRNGENPADLVALEDLVDPVRKRVAGWRLAAPATTSGTFDDTAQHHSHQLRRPRLR